MEAALSDRLRAWAKRLRGDTHLVTLIALAVLLATLAFHVLVLRPGEAKLHALQDALDQRTAPTQAEVRRAQDTLQAPAEKLAAFYAFFHRDARLSDWLARLYDVADRTGVRLQQADYRLLATDATPLLRYEVTLPTTGDYGRIRAFAEGVLNTVPVASLDHLAFRRPRATHSEVDAELRFTLHWASAP